MRPTERILRGVMGEFTVTPEFLAYLKEQEGFRPKVGYVHNMSSSWWRSLEDEKIRREAPQLPLTTYVPAAIWDTIKTNQGRSLPYSGSVVYGRDASPLPRTLPLTKNDSGRVEGFRPSRDRPVMTQPQYLSPRGASPIRVGIPRSEFEKSTISSPGALADFALARSVQWHANETQKQYDRQYGAGAFNGLNPNQQQALVDLVFHGGFLKKWPNLVQKISENDLVGAREYNVREIKDAGRAKRRERAFERTFLVPAKVKK